MPSVYRDNPSNCFTHPVILYVLRLLISSCIFLVGSLMKQQVVRVIPAIKDLPLSIKIWPPYLIFVQQLPFFLICIYLLFSSYNDDKKTFLERKSALPPNFFSVDSISRVVVRSACNSYMDSFHLGQPQKAGCDWLGLWRQTPHPPDNRHPCSYSTMTVHLSFQ